MDNVKPLKELFVPRLPLQKQIDAISQSFHQHTIGVHIRRGDHLKSIEHSPLESFISKMDCYADEADDAQFFLATDSQEVQNTLVKRYGNRVICSDIELSRSSEEGVQGAVVDLFCLSRTQRILGSSFSSFSEVAAEIEGIPLEIVVRQ